MDKLLEYLESALKNILGNKLRTGLTMLGIVIGIASVIAVVTLGNGMSDYISNEINSIGGNVAQIMVDERLTDRGVTQADLEAIEDEYPSILGTSFVAYDIGYAKGNRDTFDAYITAVGASYQYSVGTKIKEGKYFTKDQVDSGAKVCVLMETDAEHLFGTEDAIGKTIEISIGGIAEPYEIVGIRENFSEAITTMMELVEYSAQIEIPITTYGNVYKRDISKFYSFEMYWPQNESNDIVKKVAHFIENRLELRGQDAVSQYSMADVSGEVDSIMGAVTTFITLVAAISLLVGGIGVMNIMLVSVTERTREIGIRKSIGARTSSIMVQFLAEAAIISLMGGIVGVILGITLAEIGAKALEFTVTIDPVTVIFAAFFSMSLGIFFGLYPARKAAKLKPIDALARR